jgi:hypothetical protein
MPSSHNAILLFAATLSLCSIILAMPQVEPNCPCPDVDAGKFHHICGSNDVTYSSHCVAKCDRIVKSDTFL